MRSDVGVGGASRDVQKKKNLRYCTKDLGWRSRGTYESKRVFILEDTEPVQDEGLEADNISVSYDVFWQHGSGCRKGQKPLPYPEQPWER